MMEPASDPLKANMAQTSGSVAAFAPSGVSESAPTSTTSSASISADQDAASHSNVGQPQATNMSTIVDRTMATPTKKAPITPATLIQAAASSPAPMSTMASAPARTQVPTPTAANDNEVPSDASRLPRSVRWRILLGLLTIDDSSNSNSVGDAANNGNAGASMISKVNNCTLSVDEIHESNKALIEKQRERFNRLMKRYVEEVDDGQQNSPAPTVAAEETADPAATDANDNALANLDPLTAMVREQDAQKNKKEELFLKYKKERARRRRGLSTDADRQVVEDDDDGSGGDGSGYVDRASVSIIEKDLKRLPHPTDRAHEQESRIAVLKEILYIYSQEHPTMGYRQGMHEIASYILLVFELEERQAGGDSDAHNVQFAPCVAHAYHLLESVLGLLKTAYDASGENALEMMSRTILSKIYQNDQMLYQHLTASPNIPPPPIYCTRWLRLLFSREVNGFDNVLKLWDGLLGYNTKLMRALEIASAARILLMKDALLHPHTNSLELLVNTPAITEIPQFVTVFEQLMLQKEDGVAIAIPKCTIPIPPKPPVVEAFSSNGPLVNSASMVPGASIAPTGPPSPQQQLQPLPSPKKSSSSFSLRSMRESFGQDLKSIKKKVLATTSEWKQQVASREAGRANSSDIPEYSTGTMQALRASFGGRSRSDEYSQSHTHQQAQQRMMGRAPQQSQQQQLQLPTPFEVHEMMRRQKSHGERLQQHVWTLQQFLMSLEQQPTAAGAAAAANRPTDPLSANAGVSANPNMNPNNATANAQGNILHNRRVTSEIWEALADIDRIQRDLQGMPPR